MVQLAADPEMGADQDKRSNDDPCSLPRTEERVKASRRGLSRTSHALEHAPKPECHHPSHFLDQSAPTEAGNL